MSSNLWERTVTVWPCKTFALPSVLAYLSCPSSPLHVPFALNKSHYLQLSEHTRLSQTCCSLSFGCSSFHKGSCTKSFGLMCGSVIMSLRDPCGKGLKAGHWDHCLQKWLSSRGALGRCSANEVPMCMKTEAQVCWHSGPYHYRSPNNSAKNGPGKTIQACNLTAERWEETEGSLELIAQLT